MKFPVAIIVKRNRRVLWLQRKKDQSYPGIWSLPGGKIEEGESIVDAAARELKEETGIIATRFRLQGIETCELSGSYYIITMLALNPRGGLMDGPWDKRMNRPVREGIGPEGNNFKWMQQSKKPMPCLNVNALKLEPEMFYHMKETE